MTKIKRICWHWTAGPYTQTALDYLHYHYTFGLDGKPLRGKFDPEANIPPLKNGQYTAHCGGGNSYTLGLAFRGMAGYKNPGNVGKYPLTRKQCEGGWKFTANYCIKQDIIVTPETVYTHYEFGKRKPGSDSAGKIDIVHLPFEPGLKPDEVGDYIRNKVQWYLSKARGV